MEYKLLVLILILSEVFVEGQETTSRNPFVTVRDNNYQYFTYLAVLIHDNYTYCNGFVLSEKAILTAAHCVQTKRISTGFYIRILNSLEFMISMDQVNATVNLHPNYNPYNRQNDLAIVTLSESLYIEPTPNLTTRKIKEKTKCIVSRFGVSSGLENPDPPTFKEVEVTACIDQPSDHICAAVQINNTFQTGVLCDGDAGAPLVCNNELVGIAVSDDSCVTGGPDVYQSVTGFQTWIEDITLPAPIIIPTSTPITIPTYTPITIPTSESVTTSTFEPITKTTSTPTRIPSPIIIPTHTSITIPTFTPITIPTFTPITIPADTYITIQSPTPITIPIIADITIPTSESVTTSAFGPIMITTSTSTMIPSSISTPITIPTSTPTTISTSTPITLSAGISTFIPSATPLTIPPSTPITIPTHTSITIPTFTNITIPTYTPIMIDISLDITTTTPTPPLDSGSASTTVLNLLIMAATLSVVLRTK